MSEQSAEFVHQEQVVFVDTETTGLDPDRHEIWEVGLIHWAPLYDGSGRKGWVERQWQLPVDLGRADSVALRIGRYYERARRGGVSNLSQFAAAFARLTRGKHLVGAVISFDEERLRKLLRANGACPEWHYHLIDVEALAVGYLSAQYAGGNEPLDFMPPWKSHDLSDHLGIKVRFSDREFAVRRMDLGMANACLRNSPGRMLQTCVRTPPIWRH